jgi:hypothetical protein
MQAFFFALALLRAELQQGPAYLFAFKRPVPIRAECTRINRTKGLYNKSLLRHNCYCLDWMLDRSCKLCITIF